MQTRVNLFYICIHGIPFSKTPFLIYISKKKSTLKLDPIKITIINKYILFLVFSIHNRK